jgi:3-isopropylmalate/(R)-2-methylmalate dehydratase large subunit
MGMTISEKILFHHRKKGEVSPGQLVEVQVDKVMGNDISLPVAISEFEKLWAKRVFDTQKIYFVLDHLTPCRDVLSAENNKYIKSFAKKYDIKYFFDVGRAGIEHVFLPEMGYVKPGELIIAGDSHTCTYGALGAFSTGVGSTDLAYAMTFGEIWLRVPGSQNFIFSGRLGKWVGGKDLILFLIGQIGVDGAHYKSMEFKGETISSLPMNERFTLCNMAVEAGAKNGIVEPDEKTRAFMASVNGNDYQIFKSDEDATYVSIFEYDVSSLRPQVACPSSPANVKAVDDLNHISIDQAVIGSCTNGRIEDLRTAAELLRCKKIHPDVRMVVIPGSQKVYLQAVKEGLIEIFIEAGGVVTNPTCGPCFGGHLGILGRGERAISTTNRNFLGRMGHPTSEVYLSNPAVAAASAIKGRIIHPDEIG